MIGLITDDDIIDVLRLIHPISFEEKNDKKAKNHLHKGLAEIELAEGVKLQFVSILNHICDIQARHRVESMVAFCEGFVAELQQDQCKRLGFGKGEKGE